MSQTIENRIVEMQFDNKQFESGVQESLSTLDKLNDALKFDDASKNLQDFSKNLNQNIDLSGLSKSIEGLSDRFSVSGIAGMEVIRKLTDFAIDAGKKIASALDAPFQQIRSGGWKRAMNIEDAKFQLKGLGITWESVSNDINEAVADTAFGLDAAAKACAQLSASGVKAGEDMTRALRGISGVAAMGNTEYENIADIFTKAAGNGKIMAMELNRVSQYGLNARASLAKFFNAINAGDESVADIPEKVKKRVKAITDGVKVTEADISEFASKSKIDFQTFSYAMDNAFGKHAKAANETFMGSLRNIKAALSKIGAEFATPIIRGAIPIFNEIRIFLNDLRKQMGPVFDIFKKFTELISESVTKKLQRFRNAFLNEWDGTIHIWNALKNVVQAVVTVFAGVKSAFDQVFHPSKTLGRTIYDVTKAIESFTKKLIMNNTTLYAFTNIMKFVFTIVKSVGSILKTILPIVGKVLSIALQFVSVLTTIISHLINLVSQVDLLEVGFEALKVVGAVLLTIITKMVEIFSNFRDIMNDTSTVTGQFVAKIKDVAATIGKLISGAFLTTIEKIKDVINGLRSGDPIGYIANAITKLISSFKGLSSVGSTVGNVLSNFPEAVVYALKTGFATMHPILYTIGSTIAKFFLDGFREVTGWHSPPKFVLDFINDTVAAFKSGFTRVGSALVSVGSSLGGFLLKGFEVTAEFLSKAFKNATAALSDFGKAFKEGVANIEPYKVVLISIITILGIIALKFIKIMDSVAKIGNGLGGFLSGLGKFLTGTEETASKSSTFLQAMQGISLGIATLAGSLYLLSKIKVDTLKEVTKCLGQLIVVVLGFATAITAIEKAGNKFNIIAKVFDFSHTGSAMLNSMIGMAVAIGTLTASLWALSTIPVDTLKEVTKCLGGLIVVVGLFTSIVAGVSKGSTASFATSMVAFSGGIAVLVGSLWIIDQIKDMDNIWKKVAVLGTICAGLAAITVVLAKFAPAFSKGGLSVVLFASGVLILAKALAILGSADLTSIKNNWKELTAVILAFSAFAVTASHVGMAAALGLISFLAVLKLGLNDIGLIKKYFGSVEEGFMAMADAMKRGLRYVYDSLKTIAKDIEETEALAGTLASSAFLMIGGISALIISLGYAGKGLKQAAIGFAVVAATMAGLLWAMVKLSDMIKNTDENTFEQAKDVLIKIGEFLLILSGMSLFGEISKKGFTYKANNTLIKDLKNFMLSIGGVILAIGIFANMIGKLTPDQFQRAQAMLKEVLKMLAVISIVTGAIVSIGSKTGESKASINVFIGTIAIMGALIGALATLMYMLRNIDWEKDKNYILMVGAAFVGIVGAIIGILLAVAEVQKATKEKKTNDAWKSLLAFTGLIGVIGLIVYEFTKLKPEELTKAVWIAVSIVGLMGAITAMVHVLQKSTAKYMNLKQAKDLFLLTMGMMAEMIVAIVVLAASFHALKDVNAGRMAGQAVIISGVLAVVTLLVNRILKFTDESRNKITSEHQKNLIWTLSMIAGFIAAFAGLAYTFHQLRNVDAGRMAGQAVTIASVLTALSVLAYELVKFTKKLDASWTIMGKAGAMITAMVSLFGVLTGLFTVIDSFKSDSGDLAKKSHLIGLILVELGLVGYGATYLASKVEPTDMIKAGLTLTAMVAMFGALTYLFTIIDNIKTSDVEMFNKAETIVLVIGELTAIAYAAASLGSLAGQIGLGELTLAGMIALFAALAYVFKEMDELKDADNMFDRAQDILLVMVELGALGAACAALTTILPFVIGGEVALFGMIYLFERLAEVFLIMNNIKTEGMKAKAKAIIQVMLTLEGLGFISFIDVLAYVGGGGLDIMIELFAKLAIVFTIIDSMNLVGLEEKATIIVNTLWELSKLGAKSVIALFENIGDSGLDNLINLFSRLTIVFTIIDKMKLDGMAEKVRVMIGTIQAMSLLDDSDISDGDNITSLAESLVELAQACAIISGVALGFSTNVQSLVTALASLSATGTQLNTWIILITAIFNTLDTSIKIASINVVNSIEEMINNMIKALSDGESRISAAATKLGDTVQNSMEKNLKPSLWGSELASNYASGILSGLKKVANAASEMTKTVWSYIHYSDGPDNGWLRKATVAVFGEELGNKWADGIYSACDYVGGKVGDLTGVVSNTFQKYIPGFFEAGQEGGMNYVLGMIPALKTGDEKVDAVLNAWLNKLGRVKDAYASFATMTNSQFGSIREDQYRKNKVQIDKLKDGIKKAKHEMKDSTKVVEGYEKQIAELEAEQRTLTGEIDNTTESINLFDDGLSGLGDAGKGAKNKVKEITDEIGEFYDKMEGAISLFEEFNKQTELTSDKLLSNMKSQIDGMTDWANQIQKLAFMGIDQGLLQQLAEMGPQGYEYTNAFVNMTAEQLQQANDLYHQSLLLPAKVTSQIYGSYTVAGRSAASGFLQGLNKEDLKGMAVNFAHQVVDQMNEALDVASGYSQLTMAVGEAAGEGVTEGISSDEVKKNMADAIKLLSDNNIKSKFDDGLLNNRQMYTIGQNVTRGLANGIDSDEARDAAGSAVDRICGMIIMRAEKAFDEHSPSRVFKRIGNFVTQGLGIGISEETQFALNSMDKTADSVIDEMREALNKANEALVNDVDQPVIRPVLDLSDIQDGSRELNSMLSRNSALSASRSFGDLQNQQWNSQNALLNATMDNTDIVGAVNSLNTEVSTLKEVISNIKVVLDTGTMVGAMTPQIDQQLGMRQVYAGRGI